MLFRNIFEAYLSKTKKLDFLYIPNQSLSGKSSVQFIKFDIEVCEILNNNKFTFVNVCFQYEHNEDRGLNKKTLNYSINNKSITDEEFY